MSRPRHALSGLALLLASAGALADASATANLTNLQVRVYSLVGGTVAPSVDFAVTTGSQTRAQASWSSSSGGTNEQNGGGALSPASSSSPSGDGTSSSASISGDSFGLGAAVYSTADASSVFDGTAEGSAYLGDAGGTSTFTLSAESVLVITAFVDLSATGPGEQDFASASAELELDGAQGGNTQTGRAFAFETAGGFFGSSNSEQSQLTVSFVNPYAYAITGTFAGLVDSTASSALMSVPEPASGLLLLAGLLPLALRRRRAG